MNSIAALAKSSLSPSTSSSSPYPLVSLDRLKFIYAKAFDTCQLLQESVNDLVVSVEENSHYRATPHNQQQQQPPTPGAHLNHHQQHQQQPIRHSHSLSNVVSFNMFKGGVGIVVIVHSTTFL